MKNNEKKVSCIDVFKELKRRVGITRKARIKASSRLRKQHEFFEKVTHLYSLLILILSVWFLNSAVSDQNFLIAKILLILSLSLTFFTMYINIKNYKERASNFELNYQNLDILLNKLEREEIRKNELTNEKLKSFYREYEKLLIDRENHHDVDFWTSEKEIPEEFRWKVIRYNINQYFKNFIVATFPILLLILIYIIVNLIDSWS